MTDFFTMQPGETAAPLPQGPVLCAGTAGMRRIHRFFLWEDDGRHLRAQREGLAFEVTSCPGGGAIWTGSEDDPAYGQGTVMQTGTDICAHHF